MGTAQLAGKKKTSVSKNNIFKRIHFYDFHTILTSHNTNKHFLKNKWWGAEIIWWWNILYDIYWLTFHYHNRCSSI